jgi:uncharacterized repeat protein (TIGR01451 family)
MFGKLVRASCAPTGSSRLFAAWAAIATLGLPSVAQAALTVTPITWNIVGLDSNSPATGPKNFPIGARICSDVASTNVQANFVFDSANANVNLRPGSLSTLNFASIAAGGCVDAYFEAEVTQVPAAFDTTRRYHIAATDASGTYSTPTPRELYVEHLVSQSRNAITNVRYGPDALSLQSVAPGGALNLVVGNTYVIELSGGTATQGYEQFEAFINFSNAVFQILGVNTTYSANSSIYVSSPNDKLYANACLWENDPNSPNYRACVGTSGKTGGSNVVTTYTVRIVSGGGTTQTLNTLLYDFSGSSFHYNGDYSTGARIANIIDPASATIAKSFSPNPAPVNGVSALTITLGNPNGAALGGFAVSDNLPAGMVIATPANASTSGCGTPTLTASAGSGTISFSNGTVAANGNCVIKVNVTTAAVGSYLNTTNHLFVGGVDTGKEASATLTVNNEPPPGTGLCGQAIASWRFPTGFNVGTPASSTGTGTSAAAGAGLVANAQTTLTADGTSAWGSNGSITTGPTLVTANNEYFQFGIDTTGRTSVTMSWGMQFKSGNGPQGVALFVGTGAAPGTQDFANATAIAAQNTTVTFSRTITTGLNPTGATFFRVYSFNSGNTNPGSDPVIDDVVFTGCGAGTPPTITKNFTPNPVAVNGVSTLSFTLTNPNAAALTGAAFTDTLPAGTQVAATPAAASTCGGTWAPAAGATSLSFTGGTLPASGSCTASVNVVATTAGPHSNVSGFLSTVETGTSTGSVASATLTAVRPPQIAKRFASSPILAGGSSRLSFTITNPNPNDALNGVAFGDTFPVAPGAMRVAAVPNAATSGCGAPTFAPAANAASIAFSGGSIAAGATCTVSVDVSAPAVGTYINTSGAVSHLINAQTVNGNTASDTLEVEAPSPAIGLLKQVGPSAAGPWSSALAVNLPGNVFYRFTLENLGDVPLGPVALNDPQIDTSSCGPPGTLPVAVAANENHLFSCVVGAVPAASGVTPNTATASGTFGGNAFTDSDSAVYASTGLTLDKSVSEASYTIAGDALHYSYLVTNNGFAVLGGPVTVADDRATVACPALATVGDLDNFLDPGESLTCTATYVVTAGDVTLASVTNTATASAAGVDSNPDQVTVPLSSSADVSVVKTLTTAGPYSVGQTIQYSLLIANAGPSTATNIQVTDAPANLAITNVSGSGCAALPCTIASLASGASTSITVTVTINAAGAFDNAATVDADQPDPVPANNTDNTGNDGATGSFTPVIGIAKSATATTANADGSFSTDIVLTVRNLGDEALDTVSVTDALASAAGGDFGTYTGALPTAAGQYTVSGISASGLTANAGYTGAGANTQIASGTLAIGQAATASFTLRFIPNAAGPFDNQAAASGVGSNSAASTGDLSDNGVQPDPDGDNDPDEPGENDPTPVAFAPAPSLGIAKSASAATSNGDGTYSTTITLTVENLGNEALNAVSVNDALATATSGDFGTYTAATPAAPGQYTVTGVNAAGLSANAGFTGAGANTQIASGTLAIGQTATASFTLRFFPSGAGPFDNQATADGTGALTGNPASDLSDDGTQPDADSDNDPNEPGENDPTPIGVTLTPQIGIAKSATAATSNGDGTFSTTVTLTVENLGNEALNSVTVSDALATADGGDFGTYTAAAPAAAGQYTVTGINAAGLAVTAAFTGDGANTQIASGTLAIGQTATASFTLRFFPSGAGPFTNQATANGTGSSSGDPTSDDSDAGTEPDADGDNNPNEPGENDPTPIGVTLTPQIGIAKSVSAATSNGDGTFSTTVTLTVENLGNEALNSVTVTDALATAEGGDFGTYTAATPAAAGQYTVTGMNAANLTANGGFTGAGTDTQIASGTLSIGQTATATFTLRFFPNGAGPFNNRAMATGTGSSSGTPTTDDSDAGTEPDADGDNNPNEPGENDPTPISIALQPRIGVAKSAGAVTANGDGTYSTTVLLTVENLGNEALDSVTVADALASADGGDFGSFVAGAPAAAGQYTVTSIAAGGLTANATFTGAGANRLVASGGLAVGQTATASFVLRFFPAGAGPFANQAIAEGIGSSSGTPATDVSDDGTEPDADGDNDPNEPGENDPTPISIALQPGIGIAKAAGAVIANGDGSYSTTIVLTVENLGNEALNSVNVTDALANADGGSFGTFTAAAPAAAGQYTVTSIAASGLAANAAFTGAAGNRSIASGTLASGQTATASFVLRFFPAGAGPFNNQASADGLGASSGDPTSDLSDDGTEPDADGDNDANEPGENNPTPVSVALQPRIGIAKAAGVVTDNGDGTFSSAIMLTIENLGNEALDAVAVADALADADGGSFGTYQAGIPAAAGRYTVTGVAATGLTANPGFTGAGANRSVASGTLAIGAGATASFTLRFFPNGAGPFANQATANAVGTSSSTPTSDLSDNGVEPDANGDGNPNEPGENDPTPLSAAPTPRIGLAKSASIAVANGDGSSSTTITLAIENLGNEALNAVDVTDALATAAGGSFGTYVAGTPAAGQYTVSSLTTNGLAAVPGFTGATGATSLATGSLAIGQSASASFTLRFFPVGSGPFDNQARAAGAGAISSQDVSDLSDDGVDPDPNGNGTPDEPGENDPTPIAPALAMPTAVSDSVTTALDTPVTVSMLANDSFGSDGPSNSAVTITAAPAHGSATVDEGGTPNDPTNDRIVYTPGNGFAGNDALVYRICDANTDCATASVTITVTAAPIPPRIGIAKNATGALPLGHGVYSTTITLQVRNLGVEALDAVAVTDALAANAGGDFGNYVTGTPADGQYTVANLGATGLAATAAYTGATGNLIAATGTLAVGASATVHFDVRFNPATPGPFMNQAAASGVGATSAAIANDLSDDGTNPDPNGNANPGDPDEDTPTSIGLLPPTAAEPLRVPVDSAWALALLAATLLLGGAATARREVR